jgi:hypothetical protein
VLRLSAAAATLLALHLHLHLHLPRLDHPDIGRTSGGSGRARAAPPRILLIPF